MKIKQKKSKRQKFPWRRRRQPNELIQQSSMSSKGSSSPPILLLLLTMTITAISIFPALVQSQNDTSYDDCSPFKCGNLTFSFPFSSSLTSGHCGLPDYQITCDPSSDTPSLLLLGGLYKVKNFYQQDRLITVVNTRLIGDLTNSGSCQSLHNLSIANFTSTGSLTLPPVSYKNLTFIKCPNESSLPPEFADKVVSNNLSCSDNDQGRELLYLWRNGNQSDKPLDDPVSAPSGCDSVMVPVLLSVGSLFSDGGDNNMTTRKKLLDTLNNGFPLEWPKLEECEKCQNRSGRCGYNGSLKQIVCFCKGGACDASVKQHKLKLPLVLGVATGSCSVLLIVVLLLIFRRRFLRILSEKSRFSEKDLKFGDGLNVEQFIKTYRSTLLSDYSYNDLKKMTNGFKEKVGAGGYGNVYKGKFPDGRLVAVKILEKNTSNAGDNFINEVATIGRIHHVNIINLLGFCCDGTSKTRALIYEYMPNGSLGDLPSKERAIQFPKLAKLLEIALGVAHAIEYLHNGCELRILHLDIKPQNVLLDQDLKPKVADFGLAKAHSRNRSVVTMAGARGTVGYIAPEIFLRNLGSPSHKSDVYSFGMLLLEMVGGRKHQLEPTATDNSSEAYFPDWIYDKLVQENDHSEKEEEKEEENCVAARKMVMVGLWCIQTNPRDRPSMTRVVEMLSSSVDAIKMPPKPTLFYSPTRTHIENEINSIDDSNTDDMPLTYGSQENELL